MKNKDGIHIPEDLLAKNSERLKSIPGEPKIRKLPIWISTGVAVAATLALVFVFNLNTSPDPSTVDLSSIDVYDAYQNGEIDLDLDLLLEYASPEDFEEELEDDYAPSEDEMNEYLYELSDEEIYNYMNG